MGKKVGIFGGTFDPIHLGHLILAEEARETLGLDQVLFLPAAVPPHKQLGAVAQGRERLEMVHLAIAGNSNFRASDMELARGGVSFTADTLETLHEARPQDQHYLLIGADNLPDLPRWYRPDRILELAKIAVAHRAGYPPIDFSLLEGTLAQEQCMEMAKHIVDIPLIDISSTEIRRRRRLGRSIRYLVPHAVMTYMDAKGLYTDAASAATAMGQGVRDDIDHD